MTDMSSTSSKHSTPVPMDSGMLMKFMHDGNLTEIMFGFENGTICLERKEIFLFLEENPWLNLLATMETYKTHLEHQVQNSFLKLDSKGVRSTATTTILEIICGYCTGKEPKLNKSNTWEKTHAIETDEGTTEPEFEFERVQSITGYIDSFSYQPIQNINKMNVLHTYDRWTLCPGHSVQEYIIPCYILTMNIIGILHTYYSWTLCPRHSVQEYFKSDI